MNLATGFFLFAALIAAALGLWFILAVRALRTEAYAVFDQKRKDGLLPKGVDAARFEAAWLRAHSPRHLAYMAIAAMAVGVFFPLASWIVNAIWRWFWINTPMIEAIEPGSIIQVFFGAVIVSFATIGLVALPLMRRYHSSRPGKFETELARETSGANA